MAQPSCSTSALSSELAVSAWQGGEQILALLFRTCFILLDSLVWRYAELSLSVICTNTEPEQTADEVPDSTTPDTAFRWDPSGQQWIYNINTKAAPVNRANQTYGFTITLNDGSAIIFQFGM